MLIQSTLLALWIAGGLATLWVGALALAKVEPAGQIPTDAAGWPPWVERVGVPIAILVVVVVALVRIAKWARPKADALIDGTLAKANALPLLLEAQEARDRRREIQEAAFLAEIRALSARVDDLASRLSVQSQRVHLVSEHISQRTQRDEALAAQVAEVFSGLVALVERSRGWTPG